MIIYIKKDILLRFIEKSLESDFELCGLALGLYRGKDIEIVDIIHVRNISESRYRFEMDPIDIYTAFQIAEEKGWEVVGVVHSHPAEPIPSIYDREMMKYWDIIWIIIDSRNGDYKAWKGDSEIKMKFI